MEIHFRRGQEEQRTKKTLPLDRAPGHGEQGTRHFLTEGLSKEPHPLPGHTVLPTHGACMARFHNY